MIKGTQDLARNNLMVRTVGKLVEQAQDLPGLRRSLRIDRLLRVAQRLRDKKRTQGHEQHHGHDQDCWIGGSPKLEHAFLGFSSLGSVVQQAAKTIRLRCSPGGGSTPTCCKATVPWQAAAGKVIN